MGPAQSILQAPLLILCWVGLVVLPAALFSTRRLRPRGAWLAVALLWGGIGAFQVALSLSDSGQFLGLGALVLGLALLVGLQSVLWRPRAEGLAELRRVAVLVLPGFPLAVAAASGTEEALGWSELDALKRTFESGLRQLPLLVSPRVALVVTYLGLWCLASWALPERWRVAPPVAESKAGSEGAQRLAGDRARGAGAPSDLRPPSSRDPLSSSNEGRVRAPGPKT